jgi:rhodanese-related sulfurtransferase
MPWAVVQCYQHTQGGGRGVEVPCISAEEFAEKYRSGALKDATLLDVREWEEWLVDRLEEAEFLPLSSFPPPPGRLNPEKPIYVFCAHGVRSVYATDLLLRQGYPRVIHVEGGLARVRLLLEK